MGCVPLTILKTKTRYASPVSTFPQSPALCRGLSFGHADRDAQPHRPMRLPALLLALALMSCQGDVSMPTPDTSPLPVQSPEAPEAKPETPAMTPEVANATLAEVAADPTTPVEEIKFLLSQGADPRQTKTDVMGVDTPLFYYVASQGSEGAVMAFLDAGATWDQLNQDQLDQALLMVACDGTPNVLKKLLGAGADPNYKNQFDETPLALALNYSVCGNDGAALKMAYLREAGATD